MKSLEEALAKHDVLLSNIKQNLPDLEKLLADVDSHWKAEDMFYRYYHRSYKVFYIQSLTKDIYETLKKISPNENKEDMASFFLNIIKEGASGKEFKFEYNRTWEKTCRPFLEAFFHSRYFLEMTIKYGKKYEKAPNLVDSGWAALLELYNIR